MNQNGCARKQVIVPVTGVTIILFGSLTASGQLNEKSRRSCRCAALEYHTRTKPKNHFQGNKLTRRTCEASATIILASRDRRQRERQGATNCMASLLISCWGIPSEAITAVSGRRFLDIARLVTDRKLLQNKLVVIGKGPLFLGLSLLEFDFKRSGITQVEYADPASVGLGRRKDDR